MKRLPTNVSNFEKMITGNYVYVDKTKIIYQLLQNDSLFFLSRPRRFGKSLLISLLKELFSGNKELFNDTWIGQHSDYDWQEYPVIQLDFSSLAAKNAAEFESSLIESLNSIANNFNVDISSKSFLNTKLQILVQELAKKNKVVILIDEYDYPLLKNIDNPDITQEILATISSFFSAIKSLDAFGHIHAIFITGITKFSRSSIFSGMNNLIDLSMDPQAATLLGYTTDELKNNFAQYATAFAQEENVSLENIYQLIQQWYNGYRFSRNETKVYNPYSVLHVLRSKKFANYWLETGTPSFLVTLLKNNYHNIDDIEKLFLSSESLGTFEAVDIPLEALLLQAGYLTIAEYDKEENRYRLGYPNKEVESSFKRYILASLMQANTKDIDQTLLKCRNALNQNDIELFCSILTSLLATIPYELRINSEAHYHSLFQFLVSLIGIKGQSEISTNKGRIDMVIGTKNRIIIIELKFKKTGTQALQQITDRQYYEKYLHHNKPITLVGLSFNIKDKELDLDWVKKDMQ